MANQAWLESSLRRSASLGQEVLQRASRRRVDWTSTGVSQTPSTTDEDSQIPVKRAHTELDDVFAALAGLMAQTTHQCKRFYESGCGCEPSDAERSHVSRFHSRPSVVTTSARKHAKVPRYKGRVSSSSGEDLVIEVLPGTQHAGATADSAGEGQRWRQHLPDL
uniref:A-kinase-interacting protein 1 n=1 Tax=Gasterosteus aculeatus aculeatus TaxID=481459 RepID=UPI0000E3A6FF|nr:A-kinase-interacting protein 1 [Gasterosteus aculeatus aculeatus]XP_040018922.1 A-kinase-interacting protein 1 [Gasterosteus aculeatus aculeatus]